MQGSEATSGVFHKEQDAVGGQELLVCRQRHLELCYVTRSYSTCWLRTPQAIASLREKECIECSCRVVGHRNASMKSEKSSSECLPEHRQMQQQHRLQRP